MTFRDISRQIREEFTEAQGLAGGPGYVRGCRIVDPVKIERARLVAKEWKRAHPEKVRAYDARYRANNLERRRKADRENPRSKERRRLYKWRKRVRAWLRLWATVK